jgi:hypothetical protein
MNSHQVSDIIECIDEAISSATTLDVENNCIGTISSTEVIVILNKILLCYSSKKEKIIKMYDNTKGDDYAVRKAIREKYKFLGSKRKGNSYFHEILDICKTCVEENTEILDLTPIEINMIYLFRQSCITGLYKHPQAKKTEICNISIMESLKLDRIILAITKNTLFANEQWFLRLIADMKKNNPSIIVKDIIAVLSSSPINSSLPATHYKCGYKLNMQLKNPNNKIRLIFMCSHTKRFEDVIEILELQSALRDENKKQVEIYIDEAHNTNEGIPAHRACIENMLIYSCLERIIPVTGTYNTLFEPFEPSTSDIKKKIPYDNVHNAFWKKDILDKHAINYKTYCSVKSNSPTYSSLQDAICISIEKIKSQAAFTNYTDTHFDSNSYKKCYPTIKDESEIERKRMIEYHYFMKSERDAFCIVKNIFDNSTIIPYEWNDAFYNEPIFLKDIFNLHIMRSPNRIIFTYEAMLYAIEQDYQPVCIGLYNNNSSCVVSRINIMFKDQMNNTVQLSYEKDIQQNELNGNSSSNELNGNSSSKELNDKIHDIIKYLEATGIHRNRPFIIIGNYANTGESITFVNDKYGTVRSTTILPGSTNSREQDNQTLCRGNYMLTRFVANDPTFIPPPKFIIGYDDNLKNAIEIEISNDKRIDAFEELAMSETAATLELETPIDFTPYMVSNMESDGSIISIPVKIEINDPDDEYSIELRQIFTENSRRTAAHCSRIIELLDILWNGQIISIHDKSGKMFIENIETGEKTINPTFILRSVRTYNKNVNENGEDNTNTYRFETYNARFTSGAGFMNDRTHHKKYDCELEMCITRYEKQRPTGKMFINFPKTMWLSYKY